MELSICFLYVEANNDFPVEIPGAQETAMWLSFFQIQGLILKGLRRTEEN